MGPEEIPVLVFHLVLQSPSHGSNYSSVNRTESMALHEAFQLPHGWDMIFDGLFRFLEMVFPCPRKRPRKSCFAGQHLHNLGRSQGYQLRYLMVVDEHRLLRERAPKMQAL
jgi:hypothetical protein